MKQCSKCKKRKNENEFGKKASRKDGLTPWCKKCEREHNRRKYRKKKGGHVRKHLRYEGRHRVVGGVKQKRCSKCRKWKPEAEFYKQRRHKDGLTAWCKSCADIATNKARKQRLAVRKA